MVTSVRDEGRGERSLPGSRRGRRLAAGVRFRDEGIGTITEARQFVLAETAGADGARIEDLSDSGAIGRDRLGGDEDQQIRGRLVVVIGAESAKERIHGHIG